MPSPPQVVASIYLAHKPPSPGSPKLCQHNTPPVLRAPTPVWAESASRWLQLAAVGGYLCKYSFLTTRKLFIYIFFLELIYTIQFHWHTGLCVAWCWNSTSYGKSSHLPKIHYPLSIIRSGGTFFKAVIFRSKVVCCMLLYYSNVSLSLVVMALSISAVPESEKHSECLSEKNTVLLKCIYIHKYTAYTHTPRAYVSVCVCAISVHYFTQLPAFFHWQNTHHVCLCSSSAMMNNRWLQYSKNQRRCNDRWMFHAAIRSLCERWGYLHACLQRSATTVLCQRPVHLSCAYTFSPERHFFLP